MEKFTLTQSTEKIRRYCSYQERSHQEVRNKLYSYGLYSSEVDELLSQLISEGFLNEERYAKSFAGGKFRIKKWGRIKISNELQGHGVNKNCITIALREIDEEEYSNVLKNVLKKKADQISEENIFVKRDKIARYAVQKGYEPELVWKQVSELLPN